MTLAEFLVSSPVVGVVTFVIGVVCLAAMATADA